MVELGTRLASAGAVVFAPTYNTDITTTAGLVRASDDIVCAYQLARRTASAFGGDLTQPVTAVGWSLGADLVVLGSLQASADNTGGRCPGRVPTPDVVVGLSGCYFEFEGQPVKWFDDATNWENRGTDIHLVYGDRDAVCPAWQTDKLAESLRAEGYDVDLVALDAANHYAPVFHDLRDGQWQVITDDPAGEQTVTAIVDAIASSRQTPSAD
jgi:acetyl esterase/lipase